jgi:hypothetical protein
MGQDHERCLLHSRVRIEQALVQFRAILVNDGVERHRDVAEGDNAVRTNIRVSRRFENLEEKPVVLVSETGADTEKLAEGKMAGSS